jgi:hypothetical protein
LVVVCAIRTDAGTLEYTMSLSTASEAFVNRAAIWVRGLGIRSQCCEGSVLDARAIATRYRPSIWDCCANGETRVVLVPLVAK